MGGSPKQFGRWCSSVHPWNPLVVPGLGLKRFCHGPLDLRGPSLGAGGDSGVCVCVLGDGTYCYFFNTAFVLNLMGESASKFPKSSNLKNVGRRGSHK